LALSIASSMRVCMYSSFDGIPSSKFQSSLSC